MRLKVKEWAPQAQISSEVGPAHGVREVVRGRQGGYEVKRCDLIILAEVQRLPNCAESSSSWPPQVNQSVFIDALTPSPTFPTFPETTGVRDFSFRTNLADPA